MRNADLALILIQTCVLELLFDTTAVAESLETKSVVGFSSRIASAFSADVRDLDHHRAELLGELSAMPRTDNSTTGSRLGWHTKVLHSPSETVWIQIDLGKRLPLDWVALVPARGAAQDDNGPGYGFPLRFLIEVSEEESFSQRDLIVERTDQDIVNPHGSPMIISASGKYARFLRVTVTKPWPRREDWIVALGELLAFSSGRNVAVTRPVQASNSLTSLPSWDASNLTDGQSSLGPPVSRELSPSNGYLSVQETQPDALKWVQVDLGQSMPINEVRLFPSRPQDFADTPGNGFPVRFRIEAASSINFVDSQILFDTGEKDFVNPGDQPVTIPVDMQTARFIRVTAPRLYNRGDRCSFALAELEVWSQGKNVAIGKPIQSLDSFIETQFPRWRPEYLVDGFNSKNRIMDDLDWLQGLARRHELELNLKAIDVKRALAVDAALSLLVKSGVGVLGGIMLLSGALVWRARSVKNRAVEELRRRIAGDLHDEIGSNLSSILLLAEAANRDGGTKHANEDFATIENIAAKTNDSLREIVWFISPGKITLLELIGRMKETTPYLLGSIEYEFAIPARIREIECTLEFTRNLWLIFKEVLHNVARHSGASMVKIRISEFGNGLAMEVDDNGCGFFEESIKPGNGLLNMRRRALELRATLSIVGSTGHGTTVRLHIPRF